MRVRITKQPTGTVDGVDLSRFVEGNVYEVGPSFGNFLLASHWAEPAADDVPALVVPFEHPEIRRFMTPPKGTADDRSSRKRRRR